MESVEELRKKIDQIDERIVASLNERAELVLKIRDLKRGAGMPLHDPEREGEIMEKILEANKGPLSEEAIKHIYEHILYHMRIFSRYE